MARNEEKHAGRLNRLWLQQLDEDKLKKNPTRPGLGSLRTAVDVKKWLPSIKTDIDFYLKQSQVACYPERQIKEFTDKIDSLTGEYKAYVRKLRQLEPLTGGVPWTDRPYNRKRKIDASPNETESKCSEEKQSTFECLAAPLLDTEEDYTDVYGYEPAPTIVHNTDKHTEDLPLQFDWDEKITPTQNCKECGKSCDISFCDSKNDNEGIVDFRSEKTTEVVGMSSVIKKQICKHCSLIALGNSEISKTQTACTNKDCISGNSMKYNCGCVDELTETTTGAILKSVTGDNFKTNYLNLPYSDSSSDEEYLGTTEQDSIT